MTTQAPPLTPDEIAELTRLNERGASDREIAKAMGMPYNRIKYWRAKLKLRGLGRARSTLEQAIFDRMKAHFEEGRTCAESAALLGLTRSAISGLRARAGLRVSDHKPKVESAPKTRQRTAPKPVRLRVTVNSRQVIEQAPDAPLPPELPFDGNPVKLEELFGTKRCRFAVTPHDTFDHRFCGAPQVPDSAYCREHTIAAHAPFHVHKIRSDATWDKTILRRMG